jgi:hypothetical protein
MRIFSATCAGRGGVDENLLVDVRWEGASMRTFSSTCAGRGGVGENFLVDVCWERGRR